MPGKLDQRGQRARHAQLRFVAAVDQLQRLGEKLDLTNAAVAELKIANPLPVSSSFSMRNFMWRSSSTVVIEIAPIDEGFYFFENAGAELDRAGRRPRLDQSRALPALPPGFVIEHRRVH